MEQALTNALRPDQAPPAVLAIARSADMRAQLRRSARGGRVKAILLIAPLLIFLFVSFLLPIGLLLARAADNREIARALPRTTAVLAKWDGRNLPGDDAFVAVAADLGGARREEVADVGRRLNYYFAGLRTVLTRTARQAADIPAAEARQRLTEVDPAWGDLDAWRALKIASPKFTAYYLLSAVDLRADVGGSIHGVGEEAIYVDVIARTLGVSLSVAGLCLLLGYPLAYLLASASPRLSRWLMMMVLLPFWTSLLVRTTAWLVLLQEHGVVNSLLSWTGVISRPLELIHNRLGVLIAMTHILLPFVVLPLHAVMLGIPGVYVRAASSLGASPVRAFLRVYLPLTLPGVGAGGLLVFILALGYYITPALVGGPRDQMLSYFIAYFVNQATNWGMAAALAAVLLLIVLALYLLFAVAVSGNRLRLR